MRGLRTFLYWVVLDTYLGMGIGAYVIPFLIYALLRPMDVSLVQFLGAWAGTICGAAVGVVVGMRKTAPIRPPHPTPQQGNG